MSDHGLTVTFKHGKGYDDTWTVIKSQSNAELRHDLIEYFGLDQSAVEGLSNHELVTNLTAVVHGTSNAASVLGGLAIPAKQEYVHVNAGGNPWADLPDEFTPEEKQEEKPFAYIYKLFADATSTGDLQRIWSANQDAFSDPAVTAAYKARGKELKNG